MPGVCGKCGVPRIISRTHAWRDGCIVNKASGVANFSIYEVSFHNGLIDGVSDRIGMPIDWMVYLAGRHAAASIARNLFTTSPTLQRIFFRSPLYRRTQGSLIDFARAIGMGDIEFLGHRKGKGGAVRVTDPFHLAHCTAVILGGLDVMYGFPVAFTARTEGESYIGELLPGKRDEIGDEETYVRLTTSDLLPEPREDGSDFLPCPRCGVPAELGRLFSFDLEGGVITERESGERHIFYGHRSLNAIIREFERELGTDVNDIFLEAEKASFARKLEGYPADHLWRKDELRSYLALRGLGSLEEMREEYGGCAFAVANAFISTTLTGRLQALAERRYGEPLTRSYTSEDHVLRLTLKPGGQP